jgi:flagellar basal-body rod modification protein FlgD
MSAIPSLTKSLPTTASGSTTATAARQTTLDYNSFLQLLVAQLKNQDPTAPMDSTAYMSQLATFSQVAQSVETNTKLGDMLSRMSVSQAEGLVGQQVSSADNSVSGTVNSVMITSSGATAELSNGQTLDLGPGIRIGAGSSSQ